MRLEQGRCFVATWKIVLAIDKTDFHI